MPALVQRAAAIVLRMPALVQRAAAMVLCMTCAGPLHDLAGSSAWPCSSAA